MKFASQKVQKISFAAQVFDVSSPLHLHLTSDAANTANLTEIISRHKKQKKRKKRKSCFLPTILFHRNCFASWG